MKSFLKKIIFLCFITFGLGFSFFVFQIFIPAFKNQHILLDVSKGKTFYQVAEELEKKKLIRKAFYFKLLVKIFNHHHLPVGEYKLSSTQSIFKQFQILKKGKAHYQFVSFPEGFNHYEMAELLKQHQWPQYEEFLKKVWDKKFIKQVLKKDFPSLEGYLFPETYPINKYSTATDLIKSMLKNFLINYEKAKKPHFFSQHQAVTFASLIEKETSLKEEAFLVASVFYNRLNKNMKLQTDPTILYGMFLERGFFIEKNIRKKDILKPNKYNTYVIKGLPLGPISNPGLQSLKACFNPEKTDYLYFVSQNDGSHDFSKTYEEHKKKVYRYQIQPFRKKKH